MFHNSTLNPRAVDFSPNEAFFTNHSAEVSALDPETGSTCSIPSLSQFFPDFFSSCESSESSSASRLRPARLLTLLPHTPALSLCRDPAAPDPDPQPPSSSTHSSRRRSYVVVVVQQLRLPRGYGARARRPMAGGAVRATMLA